MPARKFYRFYPEREKGAQLKNDTKGEIHRQTNNYFNISETCTFFRYTNIESGTIRNPSKYFFVSQIHKIYWRIKSALKYRRAKALSSDPN